MPNKLETRIARLEAESDIRRLKAKYLNACDRKDVEAIRACFAPKAEIDFPPLGQFDVDGLISIFTEMAINTPIIDSHAGLNAEIHVDGDRAQATWNLSFSTIDPNSNSFRLLSAFYHDEYQKHDDGWRITRTRSDPRRIIDGRIENNQVIANLLKDEL